ncbi:hypothetical protein [Streptomyces subrutilus]|uniref:Uncharacterized protein n=1 Tax=Streptomyces subrutilus TaxID=36818 RepID=A0A1E5NXK9_9ACTN|nr:hypothetical protein [Streptomyces subrutilus]OEJ20938.1 hypothetical protein BGK67_35480 [Streptomyces subrutilus]
MTDSRSRTEHDRRVAGGLLGGAVVCAGLTLATNSMLPAVMAGGMLLSSMMTYRRTIDPRPYWTWPAWLVGAAGALLLAWPGGEAERLVLLPLAAVETAVAAVLFALWRRRRHGRGDWIVWIPETDTVLRREWSRRAAIHWAETERHGERVAISALDEFPHVADVLPLYPYRDRPGIAARRPVGQE